MEFKYEPGDVVRDKITGYEGVVINRTEWLNNCNTYGIQLRELQDGKPADHVHFDEPQLELIEPKVMTPEQETGGPSRPIPQTNR